MGQCTVVSRKSKCSEYFNKYLCGQLIPKYLPNAYAIGCSEERQFPFRKQQKRQVKTDQTEEITIIKAMEIPRKIETKDVTFLGFLCYCVSWSFRTRVTTGV